MDSVVYRLGPGSRLLVKTGKAGLFGFAGHSHVIRADRFQGEVVYYPRNPSSSHLDIRVLTGSLEVLTPPDTAEIRQVTETMRTQVLRTADYPQIRLVSRRVVPSAHGFHIIGAMTLAGQTRDLPIDVTTRIGVDTLEAASAFSLKQTDFGIKPVSAGPGGTVKVADRVTFDIRAVAVRAGPH
jgi:polyisoprenoid-binding protein YceI